MLCTYYQLVPNCMCTTTPCYYNVIFGAEAVHWIICLLKIIDANSLLEFGWLLQSHSALIQGILRYCEWRWMQTVWLMIATCRNTETTGDRPEQTSEADEDLNYFKPQPTPQCSVSHLKYKWPTTNALTLTPLKHGSRKHVAPRVDLIQGLS